MRIRFLLNLYLLTTQKSSHLQRNRRGNFILRMRTIMTRRPGCFTNSYATTKNWWNKYRNYFSVFESYRSVKRECAVHYYSGLLDPHDGNDACASSMHSPRYARARRRRTRKSKVKESEILRSSGQAKELHEVKWSRLIFRRSKILTAVVNGPTVSIGVTTPYRTERELPGERYDNSVSRSCAAQRSRILRGGRDI